MFLVEEFSQSESGNSSVICEPLHGGWSEWNITEDEECKESEGQWLKPKYRYCDNPKPRFGGSYCDESGTESEPDLGMEKGSDSDMGNTSYTKCNEINGGWSKYGNWSKCNSDCVKRRNRTCTNPEPKFNGEPCKGNPFEEQFCIEPNCYGK